MSDINLNTFPSSTTEALAYLYTKNQDLKGKSVEDIAKTYYYAYYQLRSSIGNIRQEASKNFQNPIIYG